MNTPTALDLTRTLIGFDTINPPGGERPCIDFIAGLLRPSGFDCTCVDFAPGRTSLVARLPATRSPARDPLVYSGHVDTVPLGRAPWSVDPFTGEVRDGRLYGRGASDMKSGVAACIIAGLDLAQRADRSADVVLVFSAGEETGCEGALHLASMPAVLGTCGGLVVAEPTDNRPMVGHKGALWMTWHVKGVTAHGSMPDQGENAIYKACDAIGRLRSFTFDVPAHPIMGAPTLNVGTISAGMNINSVPDAAAIGVDIRTIVGQTNSAVHDAMADLLGAEIAIETLTDMDPVYTDPEHPWVDRVHRLWEAQFGRSPAVETATYFTDASVLKAAYGHPPTVIMGPGPMAMAHQTDEYCEVEAIESCAGLFTRIGADYLG